MRAEDVRDVTKLSIRQSYRIIAIIKKKKRKPKQSTIYSDDLAAYLGEPHSKVLAIMDQHVFKKKLIRPVDPMQEFRGGK